MYCINCGVRLCDTEKKCPLCNTVVYHPDIKQKDVTPLYPVNKYPKQKPPSRTFNGAVLFLFLIPVIISFISDMKVNGRVTWFGFVAGAMGLFYVAFALPLWFQKPNPVIFVPVNFGAVAIYLSYINFAINGDWFISFALPVTAGIGLIITTLVTLTRYIKKGWLYIFGGCVIGFGAFMLLVEWLLVLTFGISFYGWSFYPLVAFVLLGGMLIYLGINKSAREIMERKLFF